MLRLSKTTNEKLNTLEQQKEDMEIKIAEHQVKRIKPLDENIVYKWLMSFADVDITDTLASKRMIDLFVNKVILYDDYFDIVFNASEDNAQNIKLENIKDYTKLENQLNNKKNNPNTLVRIAFLWCSRGDLNPHGFLHTLLRRACLPFHHNCKNKH